MLKTTRTILAFDEKQLDQINSLKSAFSGSDKKEISNKEMFLIAMAVGYWSRNLAEDFKRSNTGVRLQYFGPEDNVLFASLQVAETGRTESLLEIEELYNLAERYAAGGIIILSQAYLKESDFPVWFQSLVFADLLEGNSDHESEITL